MKLRFTFFLQKACDMAADVEASEHYVINSKPATITWKNVEVYESRSKMSVNSFKHLFQKSSPPTQELDPDMKTNRKLIVKNGRLNENATQATNHEF